MAGPDTCLCRRRTNQFPLADMMTMHYSFFFLVCQHQSPSRQVHQKLPARYPIRTRRGVGKPRADAISPDWWQLQLYDNLMICQRSCKVHDDTSANAAHGQALSSHQAAELPLNETWTRLIWLTLPFGTRQRPCYVKTCHVLLVLHPSTESTVWIWDNLYDIFRVFAMQWWMMMDVLILSGYLPASESVPFGHGPTRQVGQASASRPRVGDHCEGRRWEILRIYRTMNHYDACF